MANTQSANGQNPAKVKRQMEALGVYRIEFDPIIKLYCELTKQYAVLSKEFKDNEYRHSLETKDGAKKKDPLVSTLESMRKDILSYASQLGLTPAGLRKINEKVQAQKKEDPFQAILSRAREATG